jgi:hypothetical protein
LAVREALTGPKTAAAPLDRHGAARLAMTGRSVIARSRAAATRRSRGRGAPAAIEFARLIEAPRLAPPTPGLPRRCAPRDDGAPSAPFALADCGEFLSTANMLAEKHKSCHSGFVMTNAIDNARKTSATSAADRRGRAYHSSRLIFKTPVSPRWVSRWSIQPRAITQYVIPANAGIQSPSPDRCLLATLALTILDARVRGPDKVGS